MPSSAEYPQPQLPRLGHLYGPARILAYICRPEPPEFPFICSPSTTSATSASSSIFSSSHRPPSPDLYPELEILDNLFLHISPWRPHPHNTLRALERAVSSARSFSGRPGPAVLASTAVRASDIRINLRSTEPRPTVFGDMRHCTSWMRPLSALGEDELRDVLAGIARRREVAEVIVLLRPAAVVRDNEPAGGEGGGGEDGHVSPSSSSSFASSDSTGVVHVDDDDDDEAPRFQLDHQW
ncbi:uncharacterized protein PG986_010280 [Apiospora aurea]|uniref:Uncharacterized protein n=1 Tax=Apiospora aurea TaxID=335848 RepID=A0ABR1QAF8_9PEZI